MFDVEGLNLINDFNILLNNILNHNLRSKCLFSRFKLQK